MQEPLATKCWDQRGCKRCKSHWRQSVGIREAVNDARAIGEPLNDATICVGIREAVNDACKSCKHWRQSVGIREAVNDARAIGDKVLGSERL